MSHEYQRLKTCHRLLLNPDFKPGMDRARDSSTARPPHFLAFLSRPSAVRRSPCPPYLAGVGSALACIIGSPPLRSRIARSRATHSLVRRPRNSSTKCTRFLSLSEPLSQYG